MKRDPLLWGALGAVLVVLASAEYDLARACGFGTYVAAGVPAALDIYAIRALRAKRDVLVVVVALILVNSASHLVSAKLLPVDWPLVVAVSAVAPLVLWRVHKLGEAPVSDHLRGASKAMASAAEQSPEPIFVAPEPADPPPVPEPVDAVPAMAVLGPWTPLAELGNGTSGTRGGTEADQGFSRHWEEAATLAEPAAEPAAFDPVPAAVPLGTGAADLDPEDTGNTTFDGHVAVVRDWLQAEPELSGTAIGTRLGKSDSYGRRLRRAALADA
ncbi:hypothetical protein [Streptomyces chryseus]